MDKNKNKFRFMSSILYFHFPQLCAAGSTIEVVRNLRKDGKLLTELQIIYIIYHTLRVRAES